jgi:hypothetical protein
LASGADGIDDAALPSGPWRLAMAFASQRDETAAIPAGTAPADAPSGAPAWRLRVRVPAEPAP